MTKPHKKAPELRFKGFTEDWEQRKLGEITSLITKGTTPKDKSWFGPVNYIKTESIDPISGNITIKANTSIEEHEGYLKRSQLKEKDILFSIVGTLGRVGIVESKDLPANTNQQIAIIRLKNSNTNFILNALKTNYIQSFIKNDSTIGAQPSLSLWQINDLEISVPNLEEQKGIGTFFKQLDNLITLHQRKYEALLKLKEAYLQNMFPAKDESVPKVRFANFGGDWEQRKVKEIFKVTRGQVLAINKTNENKTDLMPYPVYSSQTKNNGLMGYYKEYLFDTAITWTTDGANAGTVNYRSGKFYSTNVNGVLLSSEGYANKAVAEALNCVAWRYVSRVGNPKLMNNVMGDIEISLPVSIEEMDAISELLERLDILITLHQQKLEKSNLLKEAYLQRMFI